MPCRKLTAAWVIGCSFKYRHWLMEIAPLFLSSTSATSVLHLSHSPDPHSLCFPPLSLSNQYRPPVYAHVEGTWINKSRFSKRSFLNDSFEMKIKSCGRRKWGALSERHWALAFCWFSLRSHTATRTLTLIWCPQSPLLSKIKALTQMLIKYWKGQWG